MLARRVTAVCFKLKNEAGSEAWGGIVQIHTEIKLTSTQSETAAALHWPPKQNSTVGLNFLLWAPVLRLVWVFLGIKRSRIIKGTNLFHSISPFLSSSPSPSPPSPSHTSPPLPLHFTSPSLPLVLRISLFFSLFSSPKINISYQLSFSFSPEPKIANARLL